MDEPTTIDETLIAELNDLLQLDHDAVGAYTIAIDSLEDEALRQDLIRYRGDHERHIRDLTNLIRAEGGTPIEMPHVPTGVFKTAVQAAGAAGGDREILLAFKSNEGQVRDKYRRMAEAPHAPHIAQLLRTNAADEEVHYEWVSRMLIAMGAGPTSRAGKAEAGFEQIHGRTADMMEDVERAAMQAFSGVRRTVREHDTLAKAALVVGGALLLRKMIR